MRQRQRNDQPIGLDTKCISQKPVMKTCPGSLHTLPQTSVQFQIEKLFQLFTRPYNSRNCLPPKHIVDAGYVDAESLVASQTEYRIDLVGPTAKDHRWQAREQNGYALTDFSIDWEHEQARCPQGYISRSWTPTRTGNQEVIKIKFGYATCGGCPVRAQCTQSRQRTLTVRRREAHFALEAARQREQTEEFVELYDQRAGVEGVHAQGVHRMGLRRSRYIGEPRTHLHHVATAAAINVCRLRKVEASFRSLSGVQLPFHWECAL